MSDPVTNVAVLGSTGSIGRSTLEVIAASGGQIRAVALSAHTGTAMLCRQAQALRPRRILVTDVAAAESQDWSTLPEGVELLVGPEAVTGSTRMKGGLAQKMILHSLSTAVMVRQGRVLGNQMVELQAVNAKLRDRAARIVMGVARVDRSAAEACLEETGWSVSEAIARLCR